MASSLPRTLLALCALSLFAPACADDGGDEGMDEIGDDPTDAGSDTSTGDGDTGESDTTTTTTTDTSTAPDTSTDTDTGGTSEDTTTGADCAEGDGVPLGGDELLTWLEGGGYADWQAESAVHESAGPHFGGVRTFVGPCMATSLGAGNDEHPVGAAAVKELYADGDEILGWSVMIKTDAGVQAETWWWYEWYEGGVLAEGQGIGVCANCHSGGSDYFLSPWPLQ